MMSNLGKVIPSFSIGVDKYLLVIKYGDITVALEFIPESQIDKRYLVFDLTINGNSLKKFQVRFMDSEGNPLEDEVYKALDKMHTTLIDYYVFTEQDKRINSFQRLSKAFYDKYSNMMISTCIEKKDELIDFHNPDTWAVQKLEFTPEDVEYNNSSIKHYRKSILDED